MVPVMLEATYPLPPYDGTDRTILDMILFCSYQHINACLLFYINPPAMRRARPRQSFNAVLNACCRSLGILGFAAAEQWFQKTRQAASVERGSLVNPQKIKGFPTPGQRQHPQQRLSMNFFGPQHLITEMSLNHRYPHLPHLFSWSILDRRIRLYIHVHSCAFIMLYQCRMFQN
jgi:hypothetical protein